MAVVIVLIVLVVALLISGFLRPSTFHIERSTVVSTPPERIAPFINDFHQWTGWSPWEKMDPTMKKTFGGATAGVGAVYEWAGNSKVGQGRMEITASQPERIVIKLDFIKPFEGHNVATFAIVSEPIGAKVKWAMDGHVNYMMRVMGLFMNMDKMIGKDFEAGLSNLKGLAEDSVR